MYERISFNTSTGIVAGLTHAILDNPTIGGRKISGFVSKGGPFSGIYHIKSVDESGEEHSNLYHVSRHGGISVSIQTIQEDEPNLLLKLMESNGDVTKIPLFKTEPISLERVQNCMARVQFEELRIFLDSDVPYVVDVSYADPNFTERWVTVYKHGASIGGLLLSLDENGSIKDGAFIDVKTTNVIEAKDGVINAPREGAVVLNRLFDAIERNSKDFLYTSEDSFPSMLDNLHIDKHHGPDMGTDTVRLLYEYAEKLGDMHTLSNVCRFGQELFRVYLIPNGGMIVQLREQRLKIVFNPEQREATFIPQVKDELNWNDIGAPVVSSFDSIPYQLPIAGNFRSNLTMISAVISDLPSLYKRTESPVPRHLNAWNDTDCMTVDRASGYLHWTRKFDGGENAWNVTLGGREYRILKEPGEWRYTIREPKGRVTVFGKSTDHSGMRANLYVGDYFLGKAERIYEFMDPFFWEFLQACREEYRKEMEPYPFAIDGKVAYLHAVLGTTISCGHKNVLRVGDKEISISNYLGLHVGMGDDRATVYTERRKGWKETFIYDQSGYHHDNFPVDEDGKITGYGIGGQLIQTFINEWAKYYNGLRGEEWVEVIHEDSVYDHFGWEEASSYCPVSNFGVLRRMMEGYKSMCEPNTRVIFNLIPDYDADSKGEEPNRHVSVYAEVVNDRLVFTYGGELTTPMMIVEFVNPGLTKISWTTTKVDPILKPEGMGFLDCTVSNLAGVRELGFYALGDAEEIFENVSFAMWSTFCSRTDPYFIEKDEEIPSLKEVIKKSFNINDAAESE